MVAGTIATVEVVVVELVVEVEVVVEAMVVIDKLAVVVVVEVVRSVASVVGGTTTEVDKMSSSQVATPSAATTAARTAAMTDTHLRSRGPLTTSAVSVEPG